MKEMKVDFNTLTFVIAALAVYRVSLMIAAEDGPFSVFKRWREYLKRQAKPGKDAWIARGFSCPLCISFWAGWVAAIPLYQAPAQYILLALALSAVAVVIHKFLG